MRFTAILFLPMFIGCGASAPDVSAIRALMTQEQQAIGSPVVNSINMIMVPIPPGEFQMGTQTSELTVQQRLDEAMKQEATKAKMDSGELKKDDLKNWIKRQVEQENRRKGSESPQHKVKITRAFFMSSTEVTQQQFKTVMGAAPWSEKPLVSNGALNAASYVSWGQAQEFCSKLSELENAKYRLPTEAEWEYACRAGTETDYGFDGKTEKLPDHAWLDQNAYKAGEQYPHAVGQKQPNAWALFDMHGNVWEWCSDWYAKYPDANDATDPTGPENGRVRVWRGGSFSENGENLRSAARGSYGRANYRPEFAAGFRVVKELN